MYYPLYTIFLCLQYLAVDNYTLHSLPNVYSDECMERQISNSKSVIIHFPSGSTRRFVVGNPIDPDQEGSWVVKSISRFDKVIEIVTEANAKNKIKGRGKVLYSGFPYVLTDDYYSKEVSDL